MGIKDTLSNGLKGFGKSRIQVSHGTIITYTALLLILFIAFTIRVLPMRWEIPSGTLGLNEFDPFYQYSLVNKMVTDGLLSPYWPTAWINTQQFYPAGLDMSQSLPSLPMTAAIIYNIISALGVNVDLISFCSIMAPILGTLAVLLIYFVTKDLAGKTAGLLSAFVLALMPSFIQRSSLGFFDTETVGIVSLLLFIFLFLRAIDSARSLRSMVLYSIGAAGALAYFAAGWGAAYYLIDLVALFSIVLVFMKRYSQRLLFSYSITFGLGLFIAIAVPFLSPNYLTTGTVIPVAAVFAVLCIAEVMRAQITVRTKTMLAAAMLGVVVVGVALFAVFGDLTSIAGKFISVLDPFQRSSQPLIESVAEHRITAWGSMYYELGIGILFFLTGLYFTIKNPTNRNIFLLLFGLTSLYFASSMVRLLVLFAPAFAILLSIGVLGLLKPFNTLTKEASAQVTVKSKRSLRRVGREYGAIAILLIFALLVSSYAFALQTGGQPRVYESAYNPIAISAASLPLNAPNGQIPTWLNMISYIQTNLQQDEVVASWWDYGNWIGILGNVTTLCDNTTVNGTQIENVGYAMMANETESIRMLRNYDGDYVLVYVVAQIETTSTGALTGNVTFAGYGDEGKWAWMARISGGAQERFLNESFMTDTYKWTNELDFGNSSRLGYDFNDTNTNGLIDQGELIPNAMGQNSTIYKLMTHAMQQWANINGFGTTQTPVTPEFFTPAYISGLEVPFEQINSLQYRGLIPLVALYKINYDAYNNATSTSP